MSLRHTEVAAGVHRLATRYANWYLLERGGRLTVLDAGLPGDWRAFFSVLSRLGRSLSDVDAVLITHHHPDHAGNAERIRGAGARVLAHPADAPYLRGEILEVPGSPRVIHAPGHTAGSCALLLEERSLLFSGDALVTLDMTRGHTGPRIIRGPHTEDAERALESLDVLEATNAQTVLPGHGEPWTEGVKRAVAIARETG